MYTRADRLPFLPAGSAPPPCARPMFVGVFVRAGDTNEERDVEYARTVCSSCAHLNPCRLFGLQRQEEWGVWGGLTAKERQRAAANRTRVLLAREAS